MLSNNVSRESVQDMGTTDTTAMIAGHVASVANSRLSDGDSDALRRLLLNNFLGVAVGRQPAMDARDRATRRRSEPLNSESVASSPTRSRTFEGELPL